MINSKINIDKFTSNRSLDWKNILINAHKVAKKKILFDLRFSLLKKISTNYLSLNLDNKNKKSCYWKPIEKVTVMVVMIIVQLL
jgi:hypothetical protein